MPKYLIFLVLFVIKLAIVDSYRSYADYLADGGAGYDTSVYAPNSIYDPSFRSLATEAPVTPQTRTFVQNINSNDIQDVQPDLSQMPALQPIVIQSPLPMMTPNRSPDGSTDPSVASMRQFFNNFPNLFGGYNYYDFNNRYDQNNQQDQPWSQNRFEVSSFNNENLVRLLNLTRHRDKQLGSSFRKLSLSKSKTNSENAQLDTPFDQSKSPVDLIRSFLEEKRSKNAEKSKLGLMLSKLRKMNEPTTTTTPAPSVDASLELIKRLLKKSAPNAVGEANEKNKKIAALFENVLSTLKQDENQEAESSEETYQPDSESDQTESEESEASNSENEYDSESANTSD